MVTLVNLAPHALDIHLENGEVHRLPPSGEVARVAVSRRHEATLPTLGAEVPVYATSYGALEGLPEPRAATWYVVSLLCHQAARVLGRFDTLSPGEPVRDGEGKVVGAKGLAW